MTHPVVYKGNEPYIFISYSHLNSTIVWQLIEELNHRGYRIWYDDGIGLGTEFNDTIVDRIDHCRVLLSYNTTELFKSRYCKQELLYASDNGKQIINIGCSAEMPKWYQLRFFHTYQQLTVNDDFSIQSIVDKLEGSEMLQECKVPIMPEAAAQSASDGTGAPKREDGQEEMDFEVINGELVKYNGNSDRIVIPSDVTRIRSSSIYKNNFNYINAALFHPVFHSTHNCLIETSSKKLVLGCKTSIIPNDGSVVSIADSAFSGCENLKNIAIPSGITEIGSFAFSGCKNLNSIAIPSSITRIGFYAFSNCENLNSIHVPDSVISIGFGAFNGCRKLKNITFSCRCHYIESDTFRNCFNLENFIIPKGVISIGTRAFSDCIRLNDIIIPSSVNRIGDDAFSGCKNLKSITIPDSVEKIGTGAFAGCSDLMIYCKKRSYAEKYAKDYGLKYNTSIIHNLFTKPLS